MTPLTLIIRYTSVKNKEKIENQISHRSWNQVGMSTSHLLMMTMTSVTLSHPSCPPSPPSQCNDSAKVLRGSASETSGPACDCGLSHCFIHCFIAWGPKPTKICGLSQCYTVPLGVRSPHLHVSRQARSMTVRGFSDVSGSRPQD